MIVSASRRTDLPAFHSKWLIDRIAEGSVSVANPFNAKQVRTVDLRPGPEGGMEAIVLWTRNPAPLLGVVEAWEKRAIRSLWLVTVTGYPRALEPGVPPTEQVAGTLKALAGVIGSERIVWRYDPVFASRALGMDAEWHRDNFRKLADVLACSVSDVALSVYDEYGAVARRLAGASIDFDAGTALEAVGAVAAECGVRGLAVQSCCEDLASFGISPRGCIDGAKLEKLWSIGPKKRDLNQRKNCRCVESTDIGSYGLCPHGCLYCYATRGTVSNAA